jgi:hypothetical protein
MGAVRARDDEFKRPSIFSSLSYRERVFLAVKLSGKKIDKQIFLPALGPAVEALDFGYALA